MVLKYMIKDDKYFLSKTLDEITTIMNYSKDLSMNDLYDNPIYIDGIIFRMIQMSEHMNNISENLKNNYPYISWTSIKGFRNKLVHNYGGVDLKFVYLAITEDIPKLYKDLKR